MKEVKMENRTEKIIDAKKKNNSIFVCNILALSWMGIGVGRRNDFFRLSRDIDRDTSIQKKSFVSSRQDESRL